MTKQELQEWRELQLVGLDIVARIAPITACQVRLGVELMSQIQDGRAVMDDYDYFDMWHYAGKGYKPIPCWMRETA